MSEPIARKDLLEESLSYSMVDQILGDVNSAPPENQIGKYLPLKHTVEIEDLFEQKQRIVRTKLEVFASEIFERLRLRVLNLSHLEHDQNNLYVMLERLDRQARYHLRGHQEKRTFYELLFKVKQEQRTQEVECWRDIVLVMRDFLQTWEVHEQARARAMFLDHA